MANPAATERPQSDPPAVDQWTDRRLGPRRFFEFLRSRIPPGQTEATVSAAEVRAAFPRVAESTLRNWRPKVENWGISLRPSATRGVFVVSFVVAHLRLVDDGQGRLLPPRTLEELAPELAPKLAPDLAPTAPAAPQCPPEASQSPKPKPKESTSKSPSTKAKGSAKKASQLLDANQVNDPDARPIGESLAQAILAVSKMDPARAFPRFLAQIYTAVPELKEPESQYVAIEAAHRVAAGDVPVCELQAVLADVVAQRHSQRGVDNAAGLFHLKVKGWPGWRLHRKARTREPDPP